MITRSKTTRGRLLRTAGALALAGGMVALACDVPPPTSARPPAATGEGVPEAAPPNPRPGEPMTVMGEDGTARTGLAVLLRNADGTTEPALFRGPRGLGEVITGGDWELDARNLPARIQPLAPGDRIVPTPDQVAVSGRAGSVRAEGANITIRGVNNLDIDGAPPVVFVDGIRIMGDAGSFLDRLDPTEIERIEVMSGPAAGTLHGEAAAGGIIQIFTRTGAEGRPGGPGGSR